MSIPKDILEKHPSVESWAILSAYRGSIANGMYVPKSNPDSIDDKDTMSVCVPPLDYYFGLKDYYSRGTLEVKEGEWDIVCYEVRKFVGLLKKGNPNVISLLWLEPNYYLKRTAPGDLLIANRELFNSKQIYHSFTGYAYDQLKKMTAFSFNGYMGEKRKQLVTKFGYDTKNAAHLIRLLRMAIEFLNEGRFIVQRPDATQLLDIKLGGWKLEQVKEESERLFRRAEEAYDRCKLPARVDDYLIDQLLVGILRDSLGWRI